MFVFLEGGGRSFSLILGDLLYDFAHALGNTFAENISHILIHFLPPICIYIQLLKCQPAIWQPSCFFIRSSSEILGDF